MTIFLYIIIGLWLAKGLFEIIRALVPIAYDLGRDLPGLTARSMVSILDFLALIWRLAQWTDGPSQPGTSHTGKKSNQSENRSLTRPVIWIPCIKLR
jgi:hypothetical protein